MTQWENTGGSLIPTANYLYYTQVAGLTYAVNIFPTTTSVYKYCLPAGTSLFANLIQGITTIFTSMTYTYSFGYINDRGFYGPVSSPITVSSSFFTASNGSSPITGVQLYGMSGFFNAVASGGSVLVSGFTLPQNGYGIGSTGIVNYFGQTLTPFFGGVAVYRDNGPGTGRYLIGISPIRANTNFLAVAYFIDFNFPTSTTPEPTCISATLAPRFLEIFNNQLFMCGFSQAPSTVQFSDIGNPESVQPENNFDVRTNDGDFLTGMKAAFGSLFFFKNKSFDVLTGTDPTNFALTPVSDQYGCISSRAIATYQSYMMFLDKKGIVLYNGAVPVVASTKLDPIFANMNLSAAQGNAWMVHNKQRNQIWCGIPVNGSTMINKIIVFDYLINAWAHFDGLNIACAAMGYGSQTTQSVYFGGYSGSVGYFGASLSSDAGVTISMMAQTRFIADMGQSVEKLWRRLFMNTISAIGATNLWTISIFTNYSSVPFITFTQGGISFQSRSDFGVSAKAVSFQFATATASDILTLQGFSVESRFQRAT